MRYRLRTLLILLAVGPPLLALMWFSQRLTGFASPLGILVLAALYSPLWLPAGFLVYAIRKREFSGGMLLLLVALEVESLLACRTIANGMTD